MLISNGLVGAHKLESQANVPVIALTNKLARYLSTHKERKVYAANADLFKTHFRRYTQTKDGKRVSFYYINYIELCLDSLGWVRGGKHHERYKAAGKIERRKIMHDGYNENVARWLKAHSAQIIKAYKKSRIDGVREKYKWLASYHNDIAKRYTDDPACHCNLL